MSLPVTRWSSVALFIALAVIMTAIALVLADPQPAFAGFRGP
jgi:hypothetical protein